MKTPVGTIARFALGVMLLISGISIAQNTNSGDLRGVVADPSGAAIADATVIVRNVDKGIEKTFATDNAGLFDTGPIIPDHYLITVKAQGFETFIRGPITVSVGTFTINATLQIGATQTEVHVQDELPQLDTESGTQSSSLNSMQLKEVPQVGADWQNVANLLPGVAVVSGTPTMSTSVNGNQPYNSILVNGGNATLPMSQNTDVAVLETVAELKVDTSAFSAQNGAGGIVFNQVTKSGSNSWHGVVYEYLQNDALNAADFSFTGKGKVSPLRYDNYGGSVSGPVLKDKLFFYFNYDHIYKYGGASTGTASIPTSAMMSGNFTGMATIYDPTTQTVNADGTVTRKSFLEEYGTNAVPSSLISPLAKALQAYYPTPNVTGSSSNGLPQNNYSYNLPTTAPWTKYYGRLDYDITSTNRLTISEVAQNTNVTNRAIMCEIQCQVGSVEPNFAQITDVWQIRPNFLNEARLGYAHELDFYVPISINKDFPSKLGWNFAKANVPPSMNINSMQGFWPASNSVYKEFTFDPSDVVTLIKGRHVLHFGGEVLINRADSTAWGNINAGYMDFSGIYTASTNGDTKSGVGYADFLLGYADNWNAGVSPEYGGRLKVPQAFAQDDIKLKPNLTVNLGLRWQGMTGWHEVKGNMRTWDPTVNNPATNTLGAMWYGTTKANGRDSLQKPLWDLYMPRIGASYAIRPDTVIRGGIGIYGYTWSMDTYGSGMGSALSASGSLSDATNGSLPVVQIDSDGSTNYQGSKGMSINSAYSSASTTANAKNGQNVSFARYKMPVGKSLQWNLAVQHQFSPNTSAQLAYVGNHGYDLPFDTNLNQIPESKMNATDSDSDRPYPNFKSISGRTAQGYANYHSMQLSIDRRTANGLTYNASYVWSHMMDNASSAGWNTYNGGSNWQRAYNPNANYGASNFDHRHTIKGYVTYVLPLGAGHTLSSRYRAVNEAIGGWKSSLTVIDQTGRPFTACMATDNSYSGGLGCQYPNMVGSTGVSNRSIKKWFNTAAFSQPTAGTFGNNHRNNMYGPNMSQVNLSFGKEFAIREKIHFDFRADASNLLNHASFGTPNATIGSGSEGVITSLTVGGRTMQLYGRLSF